MDWPPQSPVQLRHDRPICFQGQSMGSWSELFGVQRAQFNVLWLPLRLFKNYKIRFFFFGCWTTRQPIMNIQQEDRKSQPLADTTNITPNDEDQNRWARFHENHCFPLKSVYRIYRVTSSHRMFILYSLYTNNIQLKNPSRLTILRDYCHQRKKMELLQLLSDTGVIAKQQQCKFCGGLYCTFTSHWVLTLYSKGRRC